MTWKQAILLCAAILIGVPVTLISAGAVLGVIGYLMNIGFMFVYRGLH